MKSAWQLAQVTCLSGAELSSLISRSVRFHAKPKQTTLESNVACPKGTCLNAGEAAPLKVPPLSGFSRFLLCSVNRFLLGLPLPRTMVCNTRARCYENSSSHNSQPPAKRRRITADFTGSSATAYVPSISDPPRLPLSGPSNANETFQYRSRRLPRKPHTHGKPVQSRTKQKPLQTYRGSHEETTSVVNGVAAIPQELGTILGRCNTCTEFGQEWVHEIQQSRSTLTTYKPSLQGTSPPTLSSWISPPVSPLTPPDYVHEDVINPNFGVEVWEAYEHSLFREGLRRRKYGPELAGLWKRGSTPEDVREEWMARVSRNRAAAETLSDSE